MIRSGLIESMRSPSDYDGVGGMSVFPARDFSRLVTALKDIGATAADVSELLARHRYSEWTEDQRGRMIALSKVLEIVSDESVTLFASHPDVAGDWLRLLMDKDVPANSDIVKRLTEPA